MSSPEDSKPPKPSQDDDDIFADAPPTSSSSDSDTESESSEPEAEEPDPTDTTDIFNFYDNTEAVNTKVLSDILSSPSLKQQQLAEDKSVKYLSDRYDFPHDPENWTEADLREYWADGPLSTGKPGWDPAFVDNEDITAIRDEVENGGDPPIAPFYVPYRRPYPVIPDNHYDIRTPKSVVEELDRIEEFLQWVSFVFKDGSSYEGTVWDDLAHGKGVYVAEQGLVRYEGEWLQNNMEGHGVVEVEIPDIEPVPGSKLEEEMRAEGKIIKRDYMTPEDREWLEKDIEDSVRLAGDTYEIPFYENDEWIKQFGRKPEKGRYRYAGEWKHGRMHGCGVYEVNERTIYGRFYFGQLMEEEHGCDANVSSVHSGIAEVAAAKARMFINKPDGMVREERGPYNDPQHPYLYEEEDVWMAPGFINQFYEVPDYWKTYVQDVDEEREMWLNSFYKAPLRLPMPPELEYWWENEEIRPEFILINKEPEPDPEDPSKLIYTEDPLILHTPTGMIINYVDDKEHGIRLFWQPPLKEGEEPDPEKAHFLPLGYDDFFGRDNTVEPTIWMRISQGIENTFKPIADKLDRLIEEKKKDRDLNIELVEKEFELAEAELTLKEVIEDMDEELKRMQEEEEKKMEEVLDEDVEEAGDKEQGSEQEKTAEQEEDIEEEEEDDEDEPSSFGSAIKLDSPDKEKKGIENGRSPFAAASLSLTPSLVSVVSTQLRRPFSTWKGLNLLRNRLSPLLKSQTNPSLVACQTSPLDRQRCSSSSVSFPYIPQQSWKVRAVKQTHLCAKPVTNMRRRRRSKHKSERCGLQGTDSGSNLNILSLCTPV
ncbi:protein TIC 100 isoform X1 [Apium graveolens]|uniref:protein TIC 100 isoform X1 n=2 Tax=Apium graveolens TaxID=4045 RepID=UPI003D7A79C3